MDFLNAGNIAEIFAPMQIMMVLVIALLVFGPKKLPELGKQIGSALRDLNKAKNDMMKSFSLDHEPEHHDNYTSNENYSNDYSYHSTYHYDTPSTPDLTDYTIAGYTILAPSQPKSSNGASADTHADSKSAFASTEALHKGEQHV